MCHQKMNNFKTFFEKLIEHFENTINTISLQTLIGLIVSRRFPIDENGAYSKELTAQIEALIFELKQKNFNSELFTVKSLIFAAK